MKTDFTVSLSTDNGECSELLQNHHYLGKLGFKWKNGFNYVLKDSGEKVRGVCIFTPLPVPELVVGMFGLPRDQQQGMFELSRLTLDPEVQKTEHNMASYFVAKCIQNLRKRQQVKCILSYADSAHHEGTLYRALGFIYCGLTEDKKDFWIKTGNGYVKHQRGPMKGLEGEWRPRSRKHRFVKVFDKTLTLKWKQPTENLNG